jgi:hypothetical protein
MEEIQIKITKTFQRKVGTGQVKGRIEKIKTNKLKGCISIMKT